MAPSSTSHPTSQSSPPQEHNTIITPPKRSLRSRGSNVAVNNPQESTGGGGDGSGMEVDVVGNDARGKFPPFCICVFSPPFAVPEKSKPAGGTINGG
jgi:hypothetical protein